MANISFKREVTGTVDEIVQKVTVALSSQGFGILTRIDFDKKIREKLNKEIKQVVILGACNPSLAYEAFLRNPDVTSLLPCNAVVRDIGDGKVSLELVKPSELMKMLGDLDLAKLSEDADIRLKIAIDSL